MIVLLVVIGYPAWEFQGGGSLDSYTALAVGIALLHFLAALWVRHDAKKRGIDRVDIWMAAVLIPAIGVFGLLAYLVTRNSHHNQ